MTPDLPSQSEHFPLIDSTDHDILMHRDAHFSGSFPLMIDYYKKQERGIQEEFSLTRIEHLYEMEKNIKENLSALFLTAPEVQQVADARDTYRKLRAIYELKKTQTFIPQLIANLIFAEDQEVDSAIEALVAAKPDSVPLLIELLRNEDFYNPLFPGYGQAPFLAAQTLGIIGDKRALISLFEAIGQGDFFADEMILKAFSTLGEPAKQFLLTIVKSQPLTEDNEKAAIALESFNQDPEVANQCLTLIQLPIFQKDPCLFTYLVTICVGLQDEEKRDLFRKLSTDRTLSSQQKQDMKMIIKEWESL